mgnify:CR=1 FL=1
MRRRVLELIVLIALAIFGYLIVSGIQASKTSPSTNSERTTELPSFTNSAPSASPSETKLPKVIGMLNVPAADVLALPITRGIDGKTLNTGMAGAYPWSGPGESGVFALAAH